ncbi:cytochrome P450 302a1, mitochondrial-like [Limulus polyphemus]|uniref:Cytochrome P450 302a1, mitochondrial-like n=1 Tax=Limulus polyphemus TaxID=6850 RepID=A0ABM1T3S8_LIMPO|nr:cytochrome P450 302a1, mitochondrial-like [Limulus polyphemus]
MKRTLNIFVFGRHFSTFASDRFRHQVVNSTSSSSKECSSEFVNAKHFDSIPCPRSLPVVGHLYLFSRWGPYSFERLYDAYEDLNRKYGSIVRLDLGVCFLALFDPEDIKVMFRHEGRYPTRPVFEALKLCRTRNPHKYRSAGIISESGKEWYRLRRAINWMLRPDSPDPYLPSQQAVAEDFAERIRYIRNEENVCEDILNELYRYTQESVGVICFDFRLGLVSAGKGKLHDREKKALSAVNDTLDSMAKTLLGFPWWKLFRTPTFKTLEAAQDFYYSMAMENLERVRPRLERDAKGKDSSSLLFLQKLFSNEDLDKRDIALLMTEVYFAGIDTTANSLAFLLYNLARNQNVQEALYQEIKTKVPPVEKLTPSDLQNLTYLRACKKENHRLTPTAGGNARFITEDVVLSGYHVPKGTLCIGINPSICKLDKYFSNPKEFRPERWLGQEERSHPFATLPFGHGARRCVGQRFAEQEMSLCIIKILQKFRLEYADDKGVKMKMKLQIIPDRPIAIRFHDRK